MKKKCIAAACACVFMIGAAAFAGCEQGGKEQNSSPAYYGMTFTFSGETQAVDWDGEPIASLSDGDLSYRAVLEKHWNEIDWETTLAQWSGQEDSNNVSFPGISESDTESVDTLIAAIDGEVGELYSALEGLKIEIGSEEEGTVAFTVAGEEAQIFPLETSGEGGNSGHYTVQTDSGAMDYAIALLGNSDEFYLQFTYFADEVNYPLNIYFAGAGIILPVYPAMDVSLSA